MPLSTAAKTTRNGSRFKTASKDIYATPIYTPDAAGILVQALGKAIRDVKQRLGFMPKRSWQGWRRHGVRLPGSGRKQVRMSESIIKAAPAAFPTKQLRGKK